MKIAVVGAGVSGLSVAKLLNAAHDVVVFEKTSEIGGIARTKKINGNVYHLTGGHCFNSKHHDVLDFVFSIYPKDNWNTIERIAKIHFKGKFYNYPIEYSLKEIFNDHPEFVIDAIKDLFTDKDKQPENLKEWFIFTFGEALATEYFIPYNKKIWGLDPENMSYDWVLDKLPIPKKEDILKSLIKDQKDEMPHATFYYPKSNDQADFISSIARGLNIKFNKAIQKISNDNGKWIVDGEVFDEVINTMPLNEFEKVYEFPEEVVNACKKLRYNKVTNMLWESVESEQTWTYFPSADTIFHRHIHIGNFCRPRNNYIITESLGERTFEEMEQEGRKYNHLKVPLDFNVSDHAYVLYDKNYFTYKNQVTKHLKETGIKNLGRFGEWEYYNMDVCIKSAIDLVKVL
jgi:protoporphyrinogen oxidase